VRHDTKYIFSFSRSRRRSRCDNRGFTGAPWPNAVRTETAVTYLHARRLSLLQGRRSGRSRDTRETALISYLRRRLKKTIFSLRVLDFHLRAAGTIPADTHARTHADTHADVFGGCWGWKWPARAGVIGPGETTCLRRGCCGRCRCAAGQSRHHALVVSPPPRQTTPPRPVRHIILYVYYIYYYIRTCIYIYLRHDVYAPSYI